MEKYELSVKTKEVINPDFKGINALYHGFMFIPDVRKRNYTKEQAHRELERVKKSNIKIARTYYNYDFAWYLGEWNWESPKMKGFYQWLKEMQDIDVEVALNAAWCCPGDINSTCGWPWAVSPFTVQGNWQASVDNYAEWLSESLYQIIEVHGFTNVKYLHLFTEPQRPAGKIQHTDASKQYAVWLDLVKAAHNRLTADLRRSYVKFIGPNEGSTKTSIMLKWATENADDYIDIYSSHCYDFEADGNDKYNQWYEWAKLGADYAGKVNKPFWYDEYGAVNNDYRWNNGLYGTQLATANIAFINAGAQSTMLWTLFDQQWPDNHTNNPDAFFDGIHRWGTAPSFLQSDIPYRSFYAFCLLANYLNEKKASSVLTTGCEHIHIAAVKSGKDDLTIILTNEDTKDIKVEISIDADIDKIMYKYEYNPEEISPDNKADLIKYNEFFKVNHKIIQQIRKKAFIVLTTIKR